MDRGAWRTTVRSRWSCEESGATERLTPVKTHAFSLLFSLDFYLVPNFQALSLPIVSLYF